MNKPFYIDWSILEISKVVMYEFLYDFVKLKYEEKTIYVTQIQRILQST